MESALGDGWWNELKKYWSKVEDQTKLSLRLIKQDRIQSGLLFDEKFKSSFLRTTYTRIGDTFEQFLKDERAIAVEQQDQVDQANIDVQDKQSSPKRYSSKSTQNKPAIGKPQPMKATDQTHVSKPQTEPLNIQQTEKIAQNVRQQSTSIADEMDDAPAQQGPLGSQSVETIDLISDEEEATVSHPAANSCIKSSENGTDRLKLMTRQRKRIDDNRNASGRLKKRRKLTNVAMNTKKRHKCEFCEYSTTGNESHLTRHIRTHTHERPFECALCEKQFSRKDVLNRHMKIHQDMFAFHCSNCRQGFSDENQQKLHEKRCKAIRYECHLCKKIFLRKCNLVDHMRMHTGEELHCPNCRKQFSSNRALSYHMKSHGNLYRFQCTKCRKGFSSRTQWKLHESRCRAKQFECFLCKKTFHQKNNALFGHMRCKHTGERPFQCSVCPRQFHHKSHLVWHTKKFH